MGLLDQVLGGLGGSLGGGFGGQGLPNYSTHQADTFRYIEMGETTVLVNIAHVIEVSEVRTP